MNKVRQLVYAAVIGAAYVALTLSFLPISYGPLQVRISEALTVMPFFFPWAPFGLFAGCIVANMFGGFGLLDIIAGSLATLISGILTSKIRNKWLAPLPPVIINAAVIGGVLAVSLNPQDPWAYFPIYALQVGAGQIGACYVLGMPLLFAMEYLKKREMFPFRGNNR